MDWKKVKLVTQHCLVLIPIAGFGLLVVFFYYLLGNSQIQNSSLIVWCRQAPSTSDPREFDVATNHYAYGPVFIKLFSYYKDAVLTGSLAQSWKMEAGGTKWIFKIRPDVKFSDGQIVTAEDVVSSISRILYFAKKAGSSLPLSQEIIGADEIASVSGKIAGLTSRGDEVFMELKVPNANLPETLSFGIFGIVSKTNFDSKTGVWDESKTIASGPYAVASKDADGIQLKLRSDYLKDLESPKAYQAIKITAAVKDRQIADIIDGYADDSPGEGRMFFGKTSADILYMHIFNWQSGIWKNPALRIGLREAFYEQLQSLGFAPTRSFFPLVLSGISEIASPQSEKEISLKGVKVIFRPPLNKSISKFKAITDSLKSAVEKLGGNIEISPDIPLSDLRRYIRGESVEGVNLDLATRITSMGNDEPRSTFRFMLSKEGIYLPDPGHRLASLVRDSNFSIQQANNIVFEEGVIWPIFQFSMGFWAKPTVDLTQYNSQWPLSELQWIGAK